MNTLPLYIPQQDQQIRAQVKAAMQAAIGSMQLSSTQKALWLEHIDQAYVLQQAQHYFHYQLERWQKRMHQNLTALRHQQQGSKTKQ